MHGGNISIKIAGFISIKNRRHSFFAVVPV